MGKRWLKVDGKHGERTVAEQMEAVWPAVRECKGKTVADLGCAEGAIALEFAKAGAAHVLGIDILEDHLLVARELCAGHPVEFKALNLQEIDAEKPMEQCDIVLALGIAHKVRYPELFLRYAARSARDLLLLRCGRGMVNGIIWSKHYATNSADVKKILTTEGFALERKFVGPKPHNEEVFYWRRK